jgi:hypothetical protein
MRMPNIGGRYGARNRSGTMLRAVTDTIRVLHTIDNPGDHFLKVSNVAFDEIGEVIRLSGKDPRWFNRFDVVAESVRNYAQIMYSREKEPKLEINDGFERRSSAGLYALHEFLDRCEW